MKYLIFTALLLPIYSEAKISILISYFDAFNKAPFNNSEKVAKELAKTLKNKTDISIQLCSLPTIYDKAYQVLEDCLKSQNQVPDLVLSLGEGGCDLKMETNLRNLDHSLGPDNWGQERFNTPIIPGGLSHLSLKYPIMEMFCSLKESARNNVEISRSAGSFVCNNTAYKMRTYYPEVNYGFIHVPAHNCFMIQLRNRQTVERLERMILSLHKYDFRQTPDILLDRKDIQNQIEQKKGCEKDFFEKLKNTENNLLTTSITN